MVPGAGPPTPLAGPAKPCISQCRQPLRTSQPRAFQWKSHAAVKVLEIPSEGEYRGCLPRGGHWETPASCSPHSRPRLQIYTCCMRVKAQLGCTQFAGLCVPCRFTALCQVYFDMVKRATSPLKIREAWAWLKRMRWNSSHSSSLLSYHGSTPCNKLCDMPRGRRSTKSKWY